MEIKHNLGRDITDGELIAALAKQYPDRNITIKDNGVIELSYKNPTGATGASQESLTRLENRERREELVEVVASAMGSRASFATQSGIDAFPRAAVQLKV